MGAYTKELRAKTDEELLQELKAEGTYTPGYSRELRQEVKRRGIDPSATGAGTLSVHQRRLICEQCEFHSYAEQGNPLSDVICTRHGLHQNPSFQGDSCPHFQMIEDYRTKMALKMGLYFILAILSVLVTICLIIYQINSGNSRILIVLLAPFTLLAYSIRYLILLFRNKNNH